MKKLHLIIVLFFVVIFASCNKEDYSTIVLSSLDNTNNSMQTDEMQNVANLLNAGLLPISEAFPTNILSQLREIMPIYDGNNPPDIQGSYICSPLTIYYSNVDGEMEYYEQYNYTFADKYFCFYEQNATICKYKDNQTGTLSFSELVGISGSENNFTAYFIIDAITTEVDYTATSRQAMVVSGTKTISGIENYKYALVMLDKNDPNEILPPIGRIRAYKDGNDLAANSSWVSQNATSSIVNFNLRSAK